MHSINLNRTNIKQVLNESEKKSKKELDLTSKAILLKSTLGDFEEAFELARWSATAAPAARKTVVANFIGNKQSTFLVHQIARLKRTDATTLMKEYFNEGGNVKDIAEWLSVAGAILKTGVVPNDTDSIWGWISDAASSVADAITGAINTVADAVKAAGKSLVDAISTVASWTQNKISDFVEAILRAGHRVADILSEAAKKGTASLNKFIQAVIEAGRQGLEILNWAYNKASDILRATLRKLEQLYGSFTTLLIELGKIAASRLGPIVKELLAIGKSIRDIISRLERLAYDAAKRIVQEIKKAGKSIAEIIMALKNIARYITRIVLDALIALGNAIYTLLREAINWTVAHIAILIGALKDLGYALGTILTHVARFVGAQAIKMMRAVRVIWTVVKEILQHIAEKTTSVAHTLLVALLGTGVHLLTVLRDTLVELRAVFRLPLIKALISIGHTALNLMKEAAKISAAAAAVLFSILMDIFGSHRGLTPQERAEAEKVFGASINLDRVKLTDANWASDFILWVNGNRPFTTMYVINYKSGTTITTKTLIHELTHIWQAVNTGGVYMIEALHSQFFGKAYKLTDNDVRQANGKLENLEREQQAVLVAEYWDGEFNNNKSIPLTLDLIRPLAKQVYKVKIRFKPIDFTEITRLDKLIMPIVPANP